MRKKGGADRHIAKYCRDQDFHRFKTGFGNRILATVLRPGWQSLNVAKQIIPADAVAHRSRRERSQRC
jgi:hypothetical protein